MKISHKLTLIALGCVRIGGLAPTSNSTRGGDEDYVVLRDHGKQAEMQKQYDEKYKQYEAANNANDQSTAFRAFKEMEELRVESERLGVEIMNAADRSKAELQQIRKEAYDETHRVENAVNSTLQCIGAAVVLGIAAPIRLCVLIVTGK